MASVSVAADFRDGERLLVNKRELAKQILKCSLPTLNDLIERYPDFPVEHRGSNGVEWQFDAAAVVAFLERQRAAEQRDAEQRAELFRQFTLPIDDVAGDGAAGLPPSQRLALAKARDAERKLAIETGFLVSAGEARQVLQVTLTRFGKFLDTLPARLGRQHNLPDEVVRSMRLALEDQRRELVTELKAFLMQDADPA